MISIPSDFSRRHAAFLDSIAIFSASLVFFVFRIAFPRTRNFDEFHYVPSALQWIEGVENQNWEHPPLAKILISLGIRIFGDEPLGWRFMSAVFGALTLVGMYHLARALFAESRKAAWICVALTLFNQFLYVQSRIAMLDIFMVAFLVWGLAYFVRALDPGVFDPKWIRRSGVCMGLAIACKWFAIIPWLLCGGLLLLQALRLRSKNRLIDWLSYWIAVPTLVYYATFLPYLRIRRDPPYTFWELLTSAQANMYDGQKRVIGVHPYMSQFWEWILLKRPIWYAFDKEGPAQETVRGVFLLGNPVLMWGGLVGVATLALRFLFKPRLNAFLILFFYGAFAFCWIAIPRKVAFYYYYYPAAMMLSLVVTYWLVTMNRRWLTWITIASVAGVFIYFFPLLSASPIPASSFTKWMWLRSWI